MESSHPHSSALAQPQAADRGEVAAPYVVVEGSRTACARGADRVRARLGTEQEVAR